MTMSNARLRSLACCAMVLAVGVAADSRAQAQEKDPLIVVCLGDSITAGMGADENQSYPEQLERMLGAGYEVRSHAKVGGTLGRRDPLSIWRTEEYTKALATRPDVVVILLGTNDSKPANWAATKGQFAAIYKELIDSFVKKAGKKGIKIYCCTPPYVPKGGDGEINDDNVRAMIPLIKQVAVDAGVTLVDVHGALAGKDTLFPDKVHPNTEGARVIAGAVYKAMTGKEPPATGKK